MMIRMKNNDGSYDFGVVDKLVKHFKDKPKLELSYPTAVPQDLAMAMANRLMEVYGLDIAIVEERAYISLVGVKAIE